MDNFKAAIHENKIIDKNLKIFISLLVDNYCEALKNKVTKNDNLEKYASTVFLPNIFVKFYNL